MGNLVITYKGRELMAEMIAGTSMSTFTRVCTSACDCSGMKLEELTRLPDIKQEAAVSKVSRIDTAQVEVLAAINNSGLEEGYYVRGIGLYAAGPDGEEILYGISVESEHPDYMPAFGGRTVSGISYRLNVKVDNSEQVTIEVNPAAIPTVGQVEAVQAAADTHTKDTVCSEDGVHGFRFYNNLPQVYREESKAWIDANAASGNTARTVTKAVYQERLAAYQQDSTYKDPDSGLPFADTLYYVEDDYQDMERQAENIRYTDTCALGSANLQGIIDIIAEKVKTQLLSRSDVVDNLLSADTDLPLSANQGSILNNKIDGLYNIYPRIVITAADGLDVSQAVITATDGSHVCTGRFAGQECVITIMNLGTYTLSSTEYALSVASVEITALMQRVEVGIAEKVYLYNEGNECASLTGGWTSVIKYKGSEINELKADHMHLNSDAKNTGTCRNTQNKIDISGYTAIHVRYYKNIQGAKKWVNCVLYSELPTTWYATANNKIVGKEDEKEGEGMSEHVLDISNINEAYISVCCGNSDSATASVDYKIYEIYMI